MILTPREYQIKKSIEKAMLNDPTKKEIERLGEYTPLGTKEMMHQMGMENPVSKEFDETNEEAEEKKKEELWEANVHLAEALKYLMKGVDNLPPLTAIAGTLTKQYENARYVLERFQLIQPSPSEVKGTTPPLKALWRAARQMVSEFSYMDGHETHWKYETLEDYLKEIVPIENLYDTVGTTPRDIDVDPTRRYEYEIFIKSNEGIRIEGWYPLPTNDLTDLVKIQKAIEKGTVRKKQSATPQADESELTMTKI